jgi:manganese/zinc/iron transport system substrate-binding protein
LDSVNYQGFPDPHIWFDVSIWRTTLDPVVARLSELDPEGAEIFKANAEAYDKQLADLHESVIAAIAKIPKSQRVMITAHDAFRYLGRAYDIEVLGIQGISTESEAGVKEINDLVRVIVDRGVKAVFVESSVSQKNVQALVEGARAKRADVKIGGQLYSDALGDEDTEEGTYLGMFRHNVKTLVEALK